MGHPDQLLKYMLAIETPVATHSAARFVRAPEIATAELRPDGVLMTTEPARLSDLPAPWCHLECEAVLDGKMPGDHLDPLALERCLFRRYARQVQRLEGDPSIDPPLPPIDPSPSHCAAWVVAPHVPQFLRAWEREGKFTLEAVGEGCFSVRPSRFPILWIAANELPLHEALVPFLLARSGKKLAEFMLWVTHVRPPEWLASVVRSLPEVAAMMPDFKPDLSPEDQRRIVEGLRLSLDAYPEAGIDFIEKGVEKGIAPLARLYSRQLRRELTDAERRSLAHRLDTLGANRLGDVVLDLTPEQLGQWIADPDAR